MLAMMARIQPINVLPYDLACRSAAAPAPRADTYSLTQQRRALRLGKIRAAGVLIMVWSVLLALRRWLLDGWSAARAGAV